MRRRFVRLEPLEPRCMLSATVFEHNEVGYFLDQNEPRLARYDIANEVWLAPINLADASGVPTVAHGDDDGIYVAYDKAVYRYNPDGSGQTHLVDAQDSVIAIHSDGNLLFLNHTTGSYTRVISLDKATNTIIDTIDDYLDTIHGSSIAPQVNRIFGRTRGSSPSDITYVEYGDNGLFTANGDSPYHGDFPGALQTWVFPNGSKVVDDSGNVYSTSGLTWLNSFASSIDDIDFLGTDVPIILSGNTLTAYTPGILPTGSVTLGSTPSEIFVNDTNVITFTPDPTLPTGFRAEIVPLSDLDPPTPGEPVDPVGLPYTPDKVELAADGTVLLYSKSHQSIFRWDPAKQGYGETIPLIGTAEYMAYSSETNTIYLAYESGLIRAIDLDAAEPAEEPFATLPGRPLGLSTAGPYLFAVDPSGAWVSHYTFAPDGTLIEAVDWNYRSTEYVWNDANQKMYFFRDDTSPNDLLWEEINADGVTYPSEPPGGIGAKDDSPLHTSSGFQHPIRVAPDGSVVVLGSGYIHDATTLERLTVALDNSVTDAAWFGEDLFTARNIGEGAEFQRWTLPSYELVNSVRIPWTVHSLMTIASDRLLCITIGSDGVPDFTVMSENLAIDLGPVDFVVVDDLNPSIGGLWFSCETVREGFLTLQENFAGPSGSVELALYDQDGNQLALSDVVKGRARIDWLAHAGETYYARVTGTASDVGLCIANVLAHTGTDVTVCGTDGADTFEFEPTIDGPTAAEAGADFEVTINGVAYDFTEAELDTVAFDGALGNDRAELTVTGPKDTVTMNPAGATLTATGCTVEVTGATTVAAHGGGLTAGCIAYLNDSDGDDTFHGTPTEATMSGTTSAGLAYNNTAEGFWQVHGYARSNGADVATLLDSPGKDKLKVNAEEEWALMRGPGSAYKVRVKFFDEVVGRSVHGSKDQARFCDSLGDDKFEVHPREWAELSVPGGATYRTESFDDVLALAQNGGKDEAIFHDTSGKDKFIGRPGKAWMYDHPDHVYDVVARKFKSVEVLATASDGDVARLKDSPAVELFIGRPGVATLLSPYSQTTLHNFANVRMTSCYPDQSLIDYAKLYDTALDDLLEVSGDTARLSTAGDAGGWDLLYEVIAFDHVKAFGTAGGANAIEQILPLEFRLFLEGTWV